MRTPTTVRLIQDKLLIYVVLLIWVGTFIVIKSHLSNIQGKKQWDTKGNYLKCFR